jgi:hypothetical protein
MILSHARLPIPPRPQTSGGGIILLLAYFCKPVTVCCVNICVLELFFNAKMIQKFAIFAKKQYNERL